MLIVETIAKIRRAYFVQEKPIKAICRELRVSRKMVRKVIRSEATEFRYEREPSAAAADRSVARPARRLLVANEGKPARERLTLIRVFEELRGLGYEGGYDAVRRYARSGAPSAARRRRKPSCRCGSRRARPTSSTGATRSWCSAA